MGTPKIPERPEDMPGGPGSKEPPITPPGRKKKPPAKDPGRKPPAKDPREKPPARREPPSREKPPAGDPNEEPPARAATILSRETAPEAVSA